MCCCVFPTGQKIKWVRKGSVVCVWDNDIFSAPTHTFRAQSGYIIMTLLQGIQRWPLHSNHKPSDNMNKHFCRVVVLSCVSVVGYHTILRTTLLVSANGPVGLVDRTWHHEYCHIGRFSEAGLLEWMRFVIFRARGRSTLPGRFLIRHCFTLCITVEVEPRITKWYKCQYCCSCKNYRGKGMEGGKKVSLHRFLADQKIASL